MVVTRNSFFRVAAVFAVATLFCSCKGYLAEAEDFDKDEVPFQRIEDMFLVQTTNGVLQTRAEARVMESYGGGDEQVDIFPEGMSVYAYTQTGELETIIVSDGARHTRNKNKRDDIWMVHGNVVVQNVINRETMETDTLYWDREGHELYTNNYVKMYSSDGLMQGYGFRSNDRAGDAVILKPFNSFGVIVQDTTSVKIDSVNFIGPMQKK